MANERGSKKTVVGTVVSDRMAKTITVREERMVMHPLYGKYVRRASTYKAHDENSEARIGDKVEILYSRPFSKTKHWRLLRIVRRGTGPEVALRDELAEADEEQNATASADVSASTESSAEASPAPTGEEEPS